jgi:hypothetical protein
MVGSFLVFQREERIPLSFLARIWENEVRN